MLAGMNIATVADLLTLLRECRLLDPGHLAEAETRVAPACADPRLLARELVKRGMLTPYQVNEIFVGRGRGLLLGSYVLLEKLGEGGMGAVHKARNWKLGRVVALKLIRKDRLEKTGATDRFRREIRAAAHLDHPNIVRAIDADQVGSTHFFVMEHVEAVDLAKLVKQHGPLSVPQACDAIRQAALGLQHAYERGLVHRDIKPHNLLLTREGVVKILDMGLARFSTSEDSLSTLTQEGMVMGTIDYMAPEQALDAHHADTRADLYSLGCTFYYLLSGKVVFPGGAATEKLLKHQQQTPKPVEELRPETPAAVSAVIRKLLAKRPEERFQTPLELATALEQVQTGVPGPAPSSSTSESSLTMDWRQLGEPQSGETPRPLHVEPSGAPERRLLIAMSTGVLLMLAIVGGVIWLASASLFGPQRENNNLDQTTPSEKPKPPETVPPPIPATITNLVGMKFVRIPAGTFLMGSPETEQGRRLDEHQHEVEITRDFYLAANEVTQQQYEKVMGYNPSGFSPTGGRKAQVVGLDTGPCPVEMVSWNDAVKFCERLNDLPSERAAGRSYRLPTEAEWEYACRGGGSSYQVFAFGHSLSSDQANFNGEQPFGDAPKGLQLGRTTTVGSYQPNAFGLYDMHGNVWEWCADWYDEDYYKTSPRKDPTGPATGTSRVTRGGAWNYAGSGCRSASRGQAGPDDRVARRGFRLVCVLRGNR
jgi:formylglycine-generating enzyme required for sulfatase activity/tRNA A-37 threonylcarbamoyl transferase component Bud32